MEGDLTRERVDGVDRGRRWKRFKQRLGLKGMGCFGATFGRTPSTISVRDYGGGGDDQVPRQRDGEEPAAEAFVGAGRAPPNIASDPGCLRLAPPAAAAAAEMNLATALAAERISRSAEVVEDAAADGGGGAAPGTALRVSLMRLLEETKGGGGGGGDGEETEKGNEGAGIDTVCCVCMVRKKGAALIPCGHTYCRVCSREVWLTRGSCPLCNRPILEFLNIF